VSKKLILVQKFCEKWKEDKTFSPYKPIQTVGPGVFEFEGEIVSSDKWLMGPLALGQAIVIQAIMRVAMT